MSQLFSYQGSQVRTVTENNQTWFAAIDVCKALGITWSGATMKPIPSEWRSMLNFNMEGKTRKTSFVTEAAVYKLAFRSNKPEADKFTNWVASEVLPAIRKTGAYATPKRPERPRRLSASQGLDLMEQAVRERFAMGTPFCKSGKNGFFRRKAELPPALACISKHKLEKMADDLLACGRIERDNANHGRLRPLNVSPAIDAMPAIDAITDTSTRGKLFKKFISDVQNLAFRTQQVVEGVRLFGYNSTRLGLASHLHKMAVAELVQVQHTLYCLYHLGMEVDRD